MAAILNNRIVLYDNSFSLIYKTIDHLKKNYPNFEIIKSEDAYFDFIKNYSIDLIICNLDVEPMDAIALTKETNTVQSPNKPFIILYTDKQDDFLMEHAYNNGADAIVNYHHSPIILDLLIRALLRRKNILTSNSLNKSRNQIDEERFVIIKEGKEYNLPKKEFNLFLLLRENSNHFISKQEIAEKLWNDIQIAEKRIIDVHIYNIRKLLGKSVIQSQKGKGYRLNKTFDF